MIQKLNSKTTIYFSDDLAPDRNALFEFQNFMKLEHTLNCLNSSAHGFLPPHSEMESIVLTPDFHKGAGVPIGTVLLTKGFLIPQAMGNDINCGMRFYTTDLKEDNIRRVIPSLSQKIRHIFFEGGRNIPMTGIQREAMFREGLNGLLMTHQKTKSEGLWKLYHEKEQEKQLRHVAFHGSLFAEGIEGLDDFIGQSDVISYDDQIGSIGGGNHFIEVQRIAEIYDGQTASAWKLKKGNICVMLHTGSLTIGHHSGLLNRKICEEIYPNYLEHPDNKLYPLPFSPSYKEAYKRFFSTTYNAANFAFANRLFLGLMLQKSMIDVIGECEFELLYDSPHNFIWKKEENGEFHFLHRKGACSANGAAEMFALSDNPFTYYGEPVMLPGSMGASSYLLRGMGNPESLFSASHGAGRKLSRGEAIHGNNPAFSEFNKKFSIITPIDPNRPDVKGRRDILKKWEDMLRAEAPYAYKNIDSIVKIHQDHNMASMVARMEPIFTIKA